MTLTANALPTKRFFIDNLTRDLGFEDAILDLVDNSVDAYVRGHEIDVSSELLNKSAEQGKATKKKASAISVVVLSDKVVVADKCGGIALAHALSDVFRFGRVDTSVHSFLGVYGIGLKRAIFKIGRHIVIESHTIEDGFRVEIDVDKWAEDAADWTLPLTQLGKAPSKQEAGTKITITELTEESKLRVRDPLLITRLHTGIASTYALFLTHFLEVSLNEKNVEPKPIPIGSSEEATTGFAQLIVENVSVKLIAGLAARNQGEWNMDTAGWYVLCNGRVVVRADKTELTGWGSGVAQFASKYRGFVGIAFFYSEDPALLPWTTTKRGLNQESLAYQIARKEMAAIARPVLTFLNNMYPSEPAEEIEERRVADAVKPAEVSAILAQPPRPFTISTSGTGSRTRKISVQFKITPRELERVRKRLAKPGLGAGPAGRHAFDYFLKMECPE